MSTPNSGGQPDFNGQFQGQVPGQPVPNGQFQGQVPGQPVPNGQFQGQVPGQPVPNGQFQGQVPAQPTKSRGKMVAIISAIVVAVLVIVGGGAFALSRLGGGGYKSPEALAEGIDSAFKNNSLASLAGALSPEEVNAATAWKAEYKPNGGADWSKLADPKALSDYVSAINIKKSDMEYTVESKSEQLSLITITKWDSDVEVKPELADKLRQHYKEAKGSDLTANESASFDDMKKQIEDNPIGSSDVLADIPGHKLTLVSVKEGSKWYLSTYMTLAEMVMGTSKGEPNYSANFSDTKGASSPEEAVSGMTDALLNGASPGSEDFYRFLDLPERRVAAVYGGSSSRSGVSNSSRSADVDLHWGLSSTKVKGGAVVNFGTTSITAGDYKVEFNGNNVKLTVPSFRQSTKTYSVDYGDGLVNPERLGIFAVQDSGGWRVSLTRTVGNLNLLAATDDAVNAAVDSLPASSYRSSVSKDELRDLALSNKPLGALLVITSNFTKALN